MDRQAIGLARNVGGAALIDVMGERVPRRLGNHGTPQGLWREPNTRPKS